MHLWGEMYSMSTYCSAILFSSYLILFNSGGNGKILTGFLFGLIPFRKTKILTGFLFGLIPFRKTKKDRHIILYLQSTKYYFENK